MLAAVKFVLNVFYCIKEKAELALNRLRKGCPFTVGSVRRQRELLRAGHIRQRLWKCRFWGRNEILARASVQDLRVTTDGERNPGTLAPGDRLPSPRPF